MWIWRPSASVLSGKKIGEARLVSTPAFAVDAVTIFPEMFSALTESGITRRALEEKRWSLNFQNPRDYVESNYRTVDDRPYGGGPAW